MSRRKRYAAIAVAVAAVAVPATAAMAMPRESTALSAATFRADAPKIPAKCIYPPANETFVVIAWKRAAQSGKKRNNIQVTATVTYNACPIKDWKVGLYTSPNGLEPWTQVGKSKDTNKNGQVTFPDVTISSATYFRATTARIGALDSASSDHPPLVTVLP